MTLLGRVGSIRSLVRAVTVRGARPPRRVYTGRESAAEGVQSAVSECRMIFGEVGETLELVGVLITMFVGLGVMVALGKWWEA